MRAVTLTSISSCLVLLGSPGSHSIGTRRALVRQGGSSSIGSCLCCWGTFLAHDQHKRGLGARGCLDQHPPMPCVPGGTRLAQHRHHWCIGSPGFLEQFRHILVILGAPVSHTIGTSEALVRADAWTNISSCLVLLGSPGSNSIGTRRALVRHGGSSSIRSCLCC